MREPLLNVDGSGLTRVSAALPRRPRVRASLPRLVDSREQRVGRWLGYVAVALVVAAFGWATFTAGAAEPWAQTWLIALTAAAAVVAVVGRFVHGGPRVTVAYVPVALFVLLSLAHLASVPAWVLGIVSPHTATIRGDALGTDGAGPLSLSPIATQRHLRLLLAVVCCFVAVTQIAGNARRARWLLTGIAIVGVAAAIVVVWQVAQHPEHLPTLRGWLQRKGNSTSEASGPLVNHSHYGQLGNVAIGAGLAVMLSIASSRRDIALRYRWLVPLTMGVAVVAMSIPLSLTRGGTMAMVIGFVTFAMLYRLKRRGRSSASGSRHDRLVFVAVAVAIVGSLFGLLAFGGDDVVDRLETLSGTDEVTKAVGIRWLLWRDAMTVVGDFPLLGTGLGTFGDTYAAFRSRDVIGGTATHAENAFVQLVYETGVLGTLLCVAFVAVAVRQSVRAVAAKDNRAAFAVPGAAAGLVALFVASMTDYGQYLPAVAVGTATLFGIAIAWDGRVADGRPAKVGVAALMVALLVGSVVSFTDARNEAAAERVLADAGDRLGPSWQATPQNLSVAIRAYEEAIALWRHDARLHYELADLRWRAVRLQLPEATPDERAALQVIGRRIAADLDEAMRLAPADGRLAAASAMIALQSGGDEALAYELLRRAYEHAADEPLVAMAMAALAWSSGETDIAVDAVAVAQSQGLGRSRAIDFLLGVQALDAAEQAAGLDRRAWRDLAGRYAEGLAPDRVARVQAKQLSLLRSDADAGDANALGDLAQHEASVGNTAVAIDLYRRALDRRPGNATWRLSLASLLEDAGDEAEAMTQLRVLLTGGPNRRAEERLAALETRQTNDRP